MGDEIMYFKKLIGKKCYLSPIDPNDAEKFTEWLNDMEIIINLQLYNVLPTLNLPFFRQANKVYQGAA
jgi:hypothetical protein